MVESERRLETPYALAIGMEAAELADGTQAMLLPYAERLIGDPDTGVLHGGVITALLDQTAGMVARPEGPAGEETAIATLDLRIDYMRSATPGQQITARATCYHVTRTVAFVRAVAMDDDREAPVATATGAFTVEGGQ